MLGDKVYDSAELREELQERGTKAVIPNRSCGKQPFSFNKRTRYDRLARNYLASVCLAAASRMVDLISLDPSTDEASIVLARHGLAGQH